MTSNCNAPKPCKTPLNNSFWQQPEENLISFESLYFIVMQNIWQQRLSFLVGISLENECKKCTNKNVSWGEISTSQNTLMQIFCQINRKSN